MCGSAMVSLEKIVLDVHHFLLRIRDVLLRNLILQVDSMDHKRKEHEGEAANVIRGGAVLWCHILHKAEQRSNWEARTCLVQILAEECNM